MQAIRSKFHGKSKRNSLEQEGRKEQRLNEQPIVSESHRDLPNGGHVDHYEKTEVMPSETRRTVIEESSIPMPPPMPPANFWHGDTSAYDRIWVEEVVFPTTSTTVFERLPVEVIEKPIVVHETIMRENVEEIQAVVQVEREKTEIRQITQPLLDKEIKPVIIEEVMLDTEILPTITEAGRGAPEKMDISTREFDSTMRQVVEKKAIIEETEKWRVIEEVQPIIYREIIIPHIIRTSKPMREVIVEQPIFAEQQLHMRELSLAERERWSHLFKTETVYREVIPSAVVPISAIPETTNIRVVPAVMEARNKEIIEETTTTTTTTTAASTLGVRGVAGLSTSSSSLNGSSRIVNEPVVQKRELSTGFGPHGEKITTESITTSQRVLTGAKAI